MSYLEDPAAGQAVALEGKRPGGEHPPIERLRAGTKQAIPAGRYDVGRRCPVARVERLQVAAVGLHIVSIGDCADDSRNLDRDHDAVVMYCPRHWRCVIGTGNVLRRMRQVIALVTFSGNDDGPLLHREPDSALLGLPDGPLIRVILAVEEERIGEVAVVGYVDVVSPSPHEGADHRL